MAKTTYQQWEKPLSREQNLELFVAARLDDIDAALGNDFVAGLQLVYLSASSIQVGAGMAWVSGTGRLLASNPITVSGISLGANAWGHIYYFSNAGVPSAAGSATVPTPYFGFGSAWRKSDDVTRRYIGSIRTDGSGNILPFWHEGGDFIMYANFPGGSPNRVLSAGNSNVEVTVDASPVVPLTAQRRMIARVTNTSNQSASIGVSDDSVSMPGQYLRFVPAGVEKDIIMPLDTNQDFNYCMGGVPASGGLYVDVQGYWFRR